MAHTGPSADTEAADGGRRKRGTVAYAGTVAGVTRWVADPTIGVDVDTGFA